MSGNVEDLNELLLRQGRTRRIVRDGQQYHSRALTFQNATHFVQVQLEGVRSRTRHPSGRHITCVLRVHGVCGGKGDHSTPRAREGLEHVQHHFVRSVGRPDVGRVNMHVRFALQEGREVLAQFHEITVGIPVEPRCRSGNATGYIREIELWAGRIGVLVSISGTPGTSSWGAPYGLSLANSGRYGRILTALAYETARHNGRAVRMLIPPWVSLPQWAHRLAHHG